MFLHHNIFTHIHAYLRGQLYDTALSLQETDFTDLKQSSAVFSNIEKLLWLTESHIHTKEIYLFPLIKKAAPEVIIAFETEHEKADLLSQELQYLVIACEYAENDTEKKQCGYQLSQTFYEFIAFSLQHMNRESAMISTLLWKLHPSEKLAALQQQVERSIPSEKNTKYTEWTLRPEMFSERCQATEEISAEEPWPSLLTFA